MTSENRSDWGIGVELPFEGVCPHEFEVGDIIDFEYDQRRFSGFYIGSLRNDWPIVQTGAEEIREIGRWWIRRVWRKGPAAALPVDCEDCAPLKEQIADLDRRVSELVDDNVKLIKERDAARAELERQNGEILRIADANAEAGRALAAAQQQVAVAEAERDAAYEAAEALEIQLAAAGVGADLGVSDILDPLRALAEGHVIVAVHDVPLDPAAPVTLGTHEWPSMEAMVREIYTRRPLAFVRCELLATAVIGSDGGVAISGVRTPDLGVAL